MVRTNWLDAPADSKYGRGISASGRMSSEAFTATLTERPSITGPCHCGYSGLLNPEYTPREDGKGMKLTGYHCWLCRCDEHTPQAHALWNADQRKHSDVQGASTPMPGCGRRCERGTLDGITTPEFPSFKEWVRTNGQKALRDKYGILAHNRDTGLTVYNAKGMRIVHIPDIRNCGCDICREEKRS